MSVTNENDQSFSSINDVNLNELLLNKEYSLNAVNNYGDSLLHVSAAYGLSESVKTILSQNKNPEKYIDRKNKFGWTPLAQAVRGNHIGTVGILLDRGADVTKRTYLGTSMLTLAAGVGPEMFGTIYKILPAMLEKSVHDDVSPLCVAAMKNDGKLFSKLLELGLEVKNESVYTHLAMDQSVSPEIHCLADPQMHIQDYWNDQSDNIQLIEEESYPRYEAGDYSSSPVNDEGEKTNLPSIYVSSPKEEAMNSKAKSFKGLKLTNLDLLCLKEAHFKNNYLMSPNLIYNFNSWFAESSNQPNSPNPVQMSSPEEKLSCELVGKSLGRKHRAQRDIFLFDNDRENPLSVIPSRVIHSSDSKIENHSTEHNISLTFEPEFSPSRSPCLPSDFEDDDVCGEDTPTPPHYKTPPQGMVLNSEQAKLSITLKQFDLAHHISTFLAEEVDMSLFLTLNDQDLMEIGIANEKERKSLLAVIDSYTKHEKY